jgi:hypothetical protein
MSITKFYLLAFVLPLADKCQLWIFFHIKFARILARIPLSWPWLAVGSLSSTVAVISI